MAGIALTKEEFITRAREIHGDKYDYSKVVYVNIETPVVIICDKHGEFTQSPHSHLKGCGCRKCGYESMSKKTKESCLVCGIGINDIETFIWSQECISNAYVCWRNMILRCYDIKCLEKEPSYKGCYVCEDWLRFSNFKIWYDKNHIDGYELDKDILFKHNKIYSPETCCFVPQFLNTLLINVRKIRGQYPIGIRRVPSGRFIARVSYVGKRKHLGTFDTIEEAFAAYKQAKEAYIKEVAQKYYDEGKITERVYDALMKYEVEITD